MHPSVPTYEGVDVDIWQIFSKCEGILFDQIIPTVWWKLIYKYSIEYLWYMHLKWSKFIVNAKKSTTGASCQGPTQGLTH